MALLSVKKECCRFEDQATLFAINSKPEKLVIVRSGLVEGHRGGAGLVSYRHGNYFGESIIYHDSTPTYLEYRADGLVEAYILDAGEVSDLLKQSPTMVQRLIHAARRASIISNLLTGVRVRSTDLPNLCRVRSFQMIFGRSERASKAFSP